VRDGERHRHAAGAPDPALDGDVVEARCNEKGHARFLQVLRLTEQALRDALPSRVEIGVGVESGRVDNRGARIVRAHKPAECPD
jgi:hypothetical protein